MNPPTASPITREARARHADGSRSDGAPSSPAPAAEDSPVASEAGAPHGRVVAVAELAEVITPVADGMAAVESRFRSELQSRYESIAPLLRHGTQLGGKRLRPAMLLLAARATGELRDDHVVLGTVVEMVHTATLIHDDVLDRAETRRHTPTVNAVWNDDLSILLGDYLFAQSFRLAATLESTEACRWIGEAARRVCEGEMRQIQQRDVLDLDEATYVEMIRGKTAELCRVACELGARHAGASQSQVEALGRYGDALGIAFQIADDALDLWGDDDAVGKTLGTDLRQGKWTLPIIRLLHDDDRRTRSEAAAVLRGPTERRAERILPLLRRKRAYQQTVGEATRYRDMAIDALADVPASPSRDALARLADFAVRRRH